MRPIRTDGTPRHRTRDHVVAASVLVEAPVDQAHEHLVRRSSPHARQRDLRRQRQQHLDGIVRVPPHSSELPVAGEEKVAPIAPEAHCGLHFQLVNDAPRLPIVVYDPLKASQPEVIGPEGPDGRAVPSGHSRHRCEVLLPLANENRLVLARYDDSLLVRPRRQHAPRQNGFRRPLSVLRQQPSTALARIDERQGDGSAVGAAAARDPERGARKDASFSELDRSTFGSHPGTCREDRARGRGRATCAPPSGELHPAFR